VSPSLLTCVVGLFVGNEFGAWEKLSLRNQPAVIMIVLVGLL